jgi:integrase
VYVNTWLFEGYDDAKAALLGAVLLELSEHKNFGPKLRDGIISLLKSVNWMRATRLAMTHVALPAAAAFFTGGVAAIPAAVALSTGLSGLTAASAPAASEAKDESAPDEDLGLIKTEKPDAEAMNVRTFRDRFAKLLSDGGITTLVVIVDDLDRCTPERIVDNLEAVKLFLSAEQTAFVIGADRRIVEHAIRARYASRAVEGNDEESRRLVKDYLEKLVQVPYSLPRLSTTEIETYMTLLFCNHHLNEGDFGVCVTACNENRAKNRYASFGYAAVRLALKKSQLDKSDLSPALTAALTFSASAAPLIADGLKGNPITGLERLNPEVDVRRKRRALTSEEVGKLVAAARNSGIRVEGFSGEQRARIYLLSYMTGLRRNELGSLTPRSFDLKASPPTLTVEAAFSKHRRRDVLPLHPDLAAKLAEWTQGLAPTDRLFPKLGRRKTWEMVQADLKQAGIEYETAEGVADFHAAGRHSHITELLRSGVTLPEAKELARHSDIKTTLRYTHIGIGDRAKAVAKLPSPKLPKPSGKALQMRCTSGVSEGQSLAMIDATREVKKRDNPCQSKGYDADCHASSKTDKVGVTGD